MMRLKKWAHRLAQSAGYDFRRYLPDHWPELRRTKILHELAPELVLDVGANEGEYAGALRDQGFQGKILSFEPLNEPFLVLQRRCSTDPLWRCEKLALGNVDGFVKINVSEHRTSSSILPMSAKHLEAMPGSAYRHTESVRMARLDSLFSTGFIERERIFAKLDVQGFEMQVLEGVDTRFNQFVGLECELSLFELYQGSVIFDSMIAFLKNRGLHLVSVQPAFVDRHSGHVLQVDGIFCRRI